MISLAKNKSCTGCGACADACARGAIRMEEDAEGFRHPKVDRRRCVRCGACARACPISDPGAPRGDAPAFHAARLSDEPLLAEVSSGGVFWAFVRAAIDAGGVVYGVRQDGVDGIRHDRAETLEDAARFRRSKYLPSETKGVYASVRKDLDAGRFVLFSGTGCQVAALRSFLGAPRENLLTCEVVCHGIPSAAVWRSYRKEKEDRIGKRMSSLTFRDKSAGWSRNRYRIVYDDGSVELEDSTKQAFHAGYLAGLFNRRSCGACPFASLPRAADVTLADFWRYKGPLVRPEDNRGVSLVAIGTERGRTWFDKASAFLETEPATTDEALASCRHMSHPPAESPSRSAFFRAFRRHGYHMAVGRFLPPPRPKPRPPSRLVALWAGRARLLAAGLSGGRVTTAADADRIVRFRRASGMEATAPRSFLGSIRLLATLRPGTMVVSDNALDRAIAARRGSAVADVAAETAAARRHCAVRDAFLLLSEKGIPVYFYGRVGPETAPGWRYADSALRRMKERMDFPKMSARPAEHEGDLRELFGEKYSEAYVADIAKIPQIVQIDGHCRHEDRSSRLVNVVGGLRVTCGQPASFSRTLHVYGRCGAFGYAVEDADTMPSQLQKRLSEMGFADVRVVNHGLWGGDDAALDQTFVRDVAGIPPGDVVVFYRLAPPDFPPDELVAAGVRFKDVTREWHRAPESRWCFYDKPGHMNADGYRIVADILARDLAATGLVPIRPVRPDPPGAAAARLAAYLRDSSVTAAPEGVDAYVRSVLADHPPVPGERCGAIVMNCNPFTLGHRKLIERAAAESDRLYVFVVEEDKSFFRFEDRLRMVRDGTADLPNAVVVPSGRFMISALTFPEYFMKDYVRERPFDVSTDVRLFCERIAPPLGIRVRFAGEEPFDPVTERYNRSMAETLPRYGLEFREIPRFALPGGRVVNATEVRRILSGGRVEDLSELVPATTMSVLRERGYIKSAPSSDPSPTP